MKNNLTLNEKLAHIQTKFKSKKSRYNSFGKYNFRSAEDILEAIKPYLLEMGVSVRVEEELIGNGPFPIMQSTAIISDGENAIRATAVVGVDIDQKGMAMPQKFGSASSYGKKYALGNLLLIDDTADADSTNTHGTTKNKLTDIIAAKNYIVNGGKLDAIKKKYQLTSAQERELTTL